MKPSKPIERLFQEGLKDFQESPSSKVWEGIEKRLDQKKKKRLLPVWWLKAASVAAILAIFISIGTFYYNSSKSSMTVASSLNDNNSNSSNFNSKSLNIRPAKFSFSSVDRNLSTFNNAIDKKFAFQVSIESPSQKNVNPSAVTTSFSNTRAEEINRLQNSSISLQNKSFISSTLLGENKSTAKQSLNKKSIFDVIAEEELVAEVSDTTVDRPWEIKPNVAPVFMNSFNGGNPLESSLQGKTSSNPNVSYGVNVAYAINKKIKIRTGVNQVAMGYNTQDVLLSTSSFRPNSSSNRNIKTDLIGEVTLMSASNNPAQVTNSAFGEATSLNSIGALSHELGFLEVPLEIQYAVVDRKIGIHLLGGASTYLLNNNEVFFEEAGRSSSIGEAQNINALSFSANFGVGMDYNFSKKLSFNLEPKFLYQINTFQSSASDFQPYFFGIYSGLKLKF
ncbi:outer membrane beta-barrel protein [Psychroflexus tropicus]|uniref:outer membrane beta-barrel protein n=1 Tax=Psychroflexus tropicus TaxID=197345 RepID=UPI00037570AC|nr:outer membrane beta-barrel protein [Psychroflexus tropicus]